MEVKLKLKGDIYHNNKDTIKEILIAHDLKWRGDFGKRIFEWRNPDSKMIADFEKHPLTGATMNTFILISGEDLSFIRDMQNKLLSIGGEIYGGEKLGFENMFKERMGKWVAENMPNIQVLRDVHHAPESFIKFRLKEFEEKKTMYEKKIMKELNIQGLLK